MLDPVSLSGGVAAGSVPPGSRSSLGIVVFAVLRAQSGG
jgi:hypothetical protein